MMCNSIRSGFGDLGKVRSCRSYSFISYLRTVYPQRGHILMRQVILIATIVAACISSAATRQSARVSLCQRRTPMH